MHTNFPLGPVCGCSVMARGNPAPVMRFSNFRLEKYELHWRMSL